MGIKFFFKWLRSTYPSHIRTVRAHDRDSLPEIDHFLLDMNGIFHYACQRVFQYGAFATSSSSSFSTPTPTPPTVEDVLARVIRYVELVVRLVQPRRTVFLAVDGVAPLSKQFQQRSRRFRSGLEVGKVFDSNAITPGTVFLHALTEGLHKWLSRKVGCREWQHLQVLLSSEKVPGEGEHKLVKWIREFGDPNETYMIHGMDADLVMLALATHYPNMHILRENPYRPETEFYHLSIATIRPMLINDILQSLSIHGDSIHINDFIVMIFLTGNDFLPTIPTIELLDGGAEYLFQWYRHTLAQTGPLTSDAGFLRPESLAQFLSNLSQHEVAYLEGKAYKTDRFADHLLLRHISSSPSSSSSSTVPVTPAARDEYDPESNFSISTGMDIDEKDEKKHEEYDPSTNFSLSTLNFAAYRAAYYREKLGVNVQDEASLKKVCVAYLEGMQWVLRYYLHGVPHWRWAYPHSYAPFLSDLAVYAKEMDRPSFVERRACRGHDQNKPFPSLLQLVCVLPPSSHTLLPAVLHPVFQQFAGAYPERFVIDVDGKRNEWEGIVQLPLLPWREIAKWYQTVSFAVDEEARNRLGRTFVYRKGARPTPHGLMY